MTSRTTLKLTNRSIGQAVHNAVSRATCTEHSDHQVTGLKLQVYKSGRKIWWLRYTLNSEKQAIRIGEWPGIDVDAARSIGREMRALVDRGIDPKVDQERTKASMPFKLYAVDHYLPWAQQYKQSANSDESKVRNHLVPAFGEKRLRDIGTRDVHMYLGKLRVTLAPATCNRHLALLSKMFKLAAQWGELEGKNPCEGIDKFKESLSHQRFLNQDETRRVMAAAQQEANKYAGAAVRLLLLTGVRREEALQARWEHVDLEQATLFLPKTKSGRTRYVVLNDAARGLLADLPRVKDSPWVFPGKDPMKPLCNARKAWHRILKAAGVEQVRIHDLRHSHASLLVNQGATLYQVQALLGHASPQTTQRYSHLASKTLRDVSQLVSDVVTKAS
ncbi:tyrosine-type recombinase/integrase [Pseudomonas sp. ML2-2023-3]|uniref:tyrosine-type recombinase/integrase n=1 Tax=Pseudomonas sp. ML2-2023-3 TaxID=3122375 RepID=UPI0030CBCE18